MKSIPKFDPEILKSGQEYSRYTKERVAELHREYMAHCQKLKSSATSDQDFAMKKMMLQEEFGAKCAVVCPDSKILCDIVVDLCYRTEKSKQFAWDICGEEMLNNVLCHNNGVVRYYQAARNGEIEYCGERFTEKTMCVKDVLNEGTYLEREATSSRPHLLWKNFE